MTETGQNPDIAQLAETAVLPKPARTTGMDHNPIIGLLAEEEKELRDWMQANVGEVPIYRSTLSYALELLKAARQNALNTKTSEHLWDGKDE